MIRHCTCDARSRKSGGPGRRGMSLLEVFIALAIFIAALAVITQIISTGSRASTKAQLQSEATLRAESCMAEAVSGVIPLQNDSHAFDDDASWKWSLSVDSGPHVDTVLLVVTVEHTSDQSKVNGLATLKRIIRDPQIYLDAAGSTSNDNALDLLK